MNFVFIFFSKLELRGGREESKKELTQFLRLVLFLTSLLKHRILWPHCFFLFHKNVVSVAAVILVHTFKHLVVATKLEIWQIISKLFSLFALQFRVGNAHFCSTTGLASNNFSFFQRALNSGGWNFTRMCLF